MVDQLGWAEGRLEKLHVVAGAWDRVSMELPWGSMCVSGTEGLELVVDLEQFQRTVFERLVRRKKRSRRMPP
ncbi:hypothetical protein HQO82_13685 [Rhodococcus fascians]|nr:hypothetical protein [Rhodococcus fascians]MBY4114874.1 hypothetical protein [Rhodococcus fascians]